MDAKAFGERVEWGMKEQGWDVRRLEKELKKVTGGARGTSYASVWSYVNGQAPAEPRRNVVEGLAKLFGVRPEFLLFGGPKTEDEAEARATERSQQRTGVFWEIQEEVPGLQEASWEVDAAFMGHIRRWTMTMQRLLIILRTENIKAEMKAYALRVWEEIHMPLESWRDLTGREIPMDLEAKDNYLLAMIHARNLALQAVAPPGVSEDAVRAWPPLDEKSTEGKEE